MKHQPLTEEQKELVEKNIRLVYWVVKRRATSRVILELGKEEAAQWGMVGLVMAASRYDPSRGSAFSTYAVQWIWGTIQFHATTSRTIRHPHACFRDLEGTGMLDDLITIANEERDTVADPLRQVMDREGDPSHMIDAETMLRVLTKKERMVLILRAMDYSFRSIASLYGVSHQAIEQAHLKGLERIRSKFQIVTKRLKGTRGRGQGPRGAQPIGRVGDVERLRDFMDRLKDQSTLAAAVATA